MRIMRIKSSICALVIVVPVVLGGETFELFQFDDRDWPLYHGAVQAWCEQSSCCSAWNLTKGLLGDDARIPGLWAKVKALRDRLHSTTSDAVIWLDSDAIFVPTDWCPNFGNKSMLITPDPQPWHKKINTGFFMVKANDIGKRIFDYYWGLWDAGIKKHWEGFGRKPECPTRKIRFCHWGAAFASQKPFTDAVYPKFREHIRILPQSTTSAALEDCSGVVKHLCGNRWKLEPRYNTIRRCSKAYYDPPPDLLSGPVVNGVSQTSPPNVERGS